MMRRICKDNGHCCRFSVVIFETVNNEALRVLNRGASDS